MANSTILLEGERCREVDMAVDQEVVSSVVVLVESCVSVSDGNRRSG